MTFKWTRCLDQGLYCFGLMWFNSPEAGADSFIMYSMRRIRICPGGAEIKSQICMIIMYALYDWYAGHSIAISDRVSPDLMTGTWISQTLILLGAPKRGHVDHADDLNTLRLWAPKRGHVDHADVLNALSFNLLCQSCQIFMILSCVQLWYCELDKNYCDTNIADTIAGWWQRKQA